MYCKVKIKNENYNCYFDTNNKKNKQPLILLHGWGVSSSEFKDIIDNLNYYVIMIDFIGFGKSDDPKQPFTLDDYISQLHQMINYLQLNNVILLGHSFGGRVAIKYNYYYDIKKLILVDSAGINNKKLKTYYQIYKYKLLKNIYKIIDKEKYNKLITSSGSRDYKILSPIMKQTMNNILKQDLKKYCKNTKTKTLILWGLYDNETPVKNGYTYLNLFYNARIIIFYNSFHFPYVTEQEKFINAINSGYND